MSTCAVAEPQLSQLAVLIVEDDDADAIHIMRHLRRFPCTGGMHVEQVRSMAEARRVLDARSYDVVILDLGLPDGTGTDNVAAIAGCTDAAIVVATSMNAEHTGVEAVRNGAQDYLVKGSFDGEALFASLRLARERNQRELEAAETYRRHTEVKDRFLSHVSHELRTPLTAVSQFVTILDEGIAGEMNDTQREYLGIVRRNVDELTRMISTLMDATRASSGKLSCELQRVDVTAWLREVVESIAGQADERGIEVTTKCAGNLGEVVADAQRIGQVLRNLLENAIKFSASGSTIRVTLMAAPDEPGMVAVQVRDQGCGMSHEACERAFERLFQAGEQRNTCRKGLGLGLHIAHEIVVLHGGRIWVESEEGKGSCFTFTIPRFAIRDYVREVAVREQEVFPSLALVCVSIAAASNVARAKGVGGLEAEALRVIGGCLHGVSDVVMPHRRRAATLLVPVLARTDESGARAIAARLRTELQRLDAFGRLGFEITITTRQVGSTDHAGCGTRAVEMMAGEIERELNGIDDEEER